MSLYRIQCIEEGQVAYEWDARGSCTGIFQQGPHGRTFYKHCSPEAFIVEFRYSNRNLSRKLLEAFINTPLIQALCPCEPYGVQLDGRYKVKFNSGDIPSDQVICAMRIINVWLGDIASTWVGKFREFELNPAELMVLAMATHANGKTSDNMPVLWHVTKAELAKIAYGYNASGSIDEERIQPMSGMILPLIRGEIRQGWQPSLRVGGYAKEYGIWAAMKGHDDWAYGLGYHEACGDDNYLTVNNPLLHVEGNQTGPQVHLYGGNYTEVTEWVLAQLGK